MDKSEKAYIQKVKDVVAKNNGAVETIDELAAIKTPDLEKCNLNVKMIVGNITDLEFERNDGELDAGGLGDDESWDDAERRIATRLLDNVKGLLVDIDKENWYKPQAYSIKIAYSKLQGKKYLYEVVDKSIDPMSPDEAEKLLADMKPSIPKEHPTSPGFEFEYAKVLSRVVNSNGEPVNY